MASNPTTPLVSRKLFLNNNNLDSVTNVNSKGRPRIALDITAATTTAGTDGGDGNDGATSLSTASPTATTRIPIARSGSIRRMRNSKSFSNDHQLSRSLTRADDHYYVSTFRNSKNDFLTLNKFGSAGSMHKACSSSGSGGDNNGGGAIKSHFANGDCTDATVTANIRQNHKLAPTTTTTTNGKYFAAERSMVNIFEPLCSSSSSSVPSSSWSVLSFERPPTHLPTQSIHPNTPPELNIHENFRQL